MISELCTYIQYIYIYKLMYNNIHHFLIFNLHSSLHFSPLVTLHCAHPFYPSSPRLLPDISSNSLHMAIQNQLFDFNIVCESMKTLYYFSHLLVGDIILSINTCQLSIENRSSYTSLSLL